LGIEEAVFCCIKMPEVQSAFFLAVIAFSGGGKYLTEKKERMEKYRRSFLCLAQNFRKKLLVRATCQAVFLAGRAGFFRNRKELRHYVVKILLMTIQAV
jgi:hypothetical protein